MNATPNPKPLPSSFLSESNLVAAIMDDGRRYPEVSGIVKPADFADPGLRQAWMWCAELFARGETIGLYSLHETYGHLPVFRSIQDVLAAADTVIPSHAADYAAKLAKQARLRRTITGIDNLQDMASRATDFDELRPALEAAFAELLGAGGKAAIRSMAQVVDELRMERANPKLDLAVFPTGFKTLDGYLKGGLRESNFAVVAGPTGGGKTSFALNVVLAMAAAGIPVGFFSLEMDAKELAMRIGLTVSRDTLNEEEAFVRIEGLPLYIADNPDISADGIRAMAKVMATRHGVKVVIVDYLQLVAESGSRSTNREREVAAMARLMKITAKENRQAVVALSQTNEEGQLRESRAIDNDTDVVMHVLNHEEKEFWLRVVKNRNGWKHGHIKRADKEIAENKNPGIPMDFDAPNFRFTERPE